MPTTEAPEPAALTLRPEVAAFAAAMEAQLRKHDGARGVRGWANAYHGWLMDRLREEVDELDGVLLRVFKPGPPEVLPEAADVANFAMMIADVCGDLPAPQPAAPAPDALVEALWQRAVEAYDSVPYYCSRESSLAQLRAAFDITVSAIGGTEAALRVALAPFGQMADGKDAWVDENGGCSVFPRLKDVRAARAALALPLGPAGDVVRGLVEAAETVVQTWYPEGQTPDGIETLREAIARLTGGGTR